MAGTSEGEGDAPAERVEVVVARLRFLRERISRLQRELGGPTAGLQASEEAADAAQSAAVAALRYSSRAHANAAKAHRNFADLLARTGKHEEAKWHWHAADVGEMAAETICARRLLGETTQSNHVVDVLHDGGCWYPGLLTTGADLATKFRAGCGTAWEWACSTSTGHVRHLERTDLFVELRTFE